MLIGSLTPYYAQYWNGVDHYVYTDSTGAEYRLDVNNSGIWSSTHGVYVWFDANANILHFRNRNFWTMGCTSGGQEADAGTLYPTIIEDVSGNQVIVTYDTGLGLPYSDNAGVRGYVSTPNTSARIATIEDVRAQACNIYICAELVPRATYFFWYDRTHYAVPHLTTFGNLIQTAEQYAFTYANSALGPPFGSDPSFAGATSVQLASVGTLANSPPISSVVLQTRTFQYDAAGAGELTQVTMPWGGHFRWTYATDPYTGTRDLRAVTSRYLAADSAGATEWTYPLTRDNASAANVHATATVADASGVGAKTWNFPTTGPAWQIGLNLEFVQSTAPGGAVYTDDTYSWTQDPAGNPYISSRASVTDPGAGNQQNALRTQTADQYGNTTQAVIYPYNNATTPLRTYSSTYISSSGYISNYVRDRLQTAILITGGTNKTLVQNSYVPSYGGGSNPPQYEFDAHPPIAVGSRGIRFPP